MKRSLWRVLAILAVLSLVAAACGDDDDTDTDAGADAGTEETVADEGGDEEPEETTTTAADEEGAGDDDDGEQEQAAAGTRPQCDALEGALIGYSQPIPDPNFALIEEVIAAELSDFDAELSGVNANLDPGKQISDIETLVSQGIDVLLVNPVDPTALQDLIAGLEVPVVVQETSFGGPYFSNVTADIEDAVTQGANRLQELVGDEPVAAIIGPPFAEVLRRSAETFQAVAAEIGLNVVDVQTTQNPGSPDAAAEIASAWKVEYGDELAGIWTFNDTSAVGVASTVDDSFSPVLVSLNGQPEAIPLLEAGVIDYTYDIQQDMIARGLAYAAAAAICGESVPENIWIEPIELSPDDAGDWVNPAERGQEPLPTTLEERGDGRTFIVAAS